MALATGMDYSSYLPQEQPQQNQYLTGNPSTDMNAQTDWMKPTSVSFDPSKRSDNTGINGGATPPQGTVLGSIASGSSPIGTYMPGGYDQNKWNDPNKHDPKYDVGRVLSQYAPGPAGLDQAMSELSKQGYTRVGKDSIFRPDVGTIDAGFAFGSGDPNQMKWGWMPKDNMGAPQGFTGSNNMNGNGFMQLLMSLLGGGGNSGANQPSMGWAQPINRRSQLPNQMNPTGGGFLDAARNAPNTPPPVPTGGYLTPIAGQGNYWGDQAYKNNPLGIVS